MKTAQEIIADETIVRLTREAEERKWTTLVSRCRTPRGQLPFLAQLVMSTALLAVFASVGRQTGDYRGVYVVSGMLLFFCVPMHLWNLRKREKALLAIIELQAPLLFRRLKDEGIA